MASLWLTSLVERARTENFSEAELASLILIHHWVGKFEARWRGTRLGLPMPQKSSVEILLEGCPHAPVMSVVSVWGFRKLPRAVNQTLSLWFCEPWRFIRTDSVPTPLELLKIQAEGKRHITLPYSISEFDSIIHEDKTGAELFIHDLIHGWRYFGNPEMAELQKNYYVQALRFAHRPLFRELRAKSHGRVAEKLDYMLSDMNTHPAHARASLHATMIEALLAREGKQASDILSDEGRVHLAELVADLG